MLPHRHSPQRTLTKPKLRQHKRQNSSQRRSKGRHHLQKVVGAQLLEGRKHANRPLRLRSPQSKPHKIDAKKAPRPFRMNAKPRKCRSKNYNPQRSYFFCSKDAPHSLCSNLKGVAELMPLSIYSSSCSSVPTPRLAPSNRFMLTSTACLGKAITQPP